MRYPDEGEPWPPLPWIEDAESVDDALRDVVIPHEGEHEAEGDNGDGDDGADGDSSRRRGGRAA
jgi:hypothetical protein